MASLKARIKFVGSLLGLIFTFLTGAAAAQTIPGMRVVGYADRFSIQPGETIKFMVSSEVPQYRADIVRLIHGDTNPKGPGFKEEVVNTTANKEYPGHHQDLRAGSYTIVPNNSALQQTGSLTLTAWIAPTTPGSTTATFPGAPAKGVQGIITKWSPSENLGYGLFIDGDGSLSLWLGERDGQSQKISTGVPLPAWIPANVWPRGNQMVNTTIWYFVAATFDADTGLVTLRQEAVPKLPGDNGSAVVEQTVALRSIGANDVPLLMAGFWEWHDAAQQLVSGHFNGKIEAPKIFGRALSSQELDRLRDGNDPSDVVGAWDFSLDISSHRISDTGPNDLHGQTRQMPTRGMTGHNWKQETTGFPQARAQYGAIHFHDDDLDDAEWEVGFAWSVPSDLHSGIYAARLRAGGHEDHVPFFVRPKKGTATARIAFLAPTFSYLAYANSRSGVPQLLSMYDSHSDESGVAYSTRLRPILNMRPKYAYSSSGGLRSVHQLPADLHLIDWLEEKNYKHDIITDEDLHWEGTELLSPYKVILTGSHPEYWSTQMLDAMEAYLNRGGRLMYMGGNGFYWVTSMDSEGKHTIEIRRRDGTNTWEAAPGEYHHSTTGEFGGLWRFRGRPPQKMVGVGFAAQAGDRGRPFTRLAASFDPRASWIFDGIGTDELIGNFPSLVLEYGAAGLEVDRFDHVLGTPPHALLLATAGGFSDMYQHVIEETLQSDSKQGGTVNPWVKADMTYFETGNGGAVWSSASISWMGSLSYNDYKNNVSKLTGNVLSRFVSDGPPSDTSRSTQPGSE